MATVNLEAPKPGGDITDLGNRVVGTKERTEQFVAANAQTYAQINADIDKVNQALAAQEAGLQVSRVVKVVNLA